MRKQTMWILTLGLAAGLLAGCADKQSEHEHMNHGTVKPQKLTIEMQTAPQPVRVGQQAQLKAVVKAGETAVKDADVEFEVWKGEGAHETLKAKAAGDGTYTAEKTFAEAGAHSVTIHTTTSELHQMPTVQVEVQP